MRKYIGSILLGCALLTPIAIQADDHDRKYYDPDRKDYHNWNQGENRAYQHYAQERKVQNREFRRLDRQRQRDYWRWRHDHPDNVIFPR